MIDYKAIVMQDPLSYFKTSYNKVDPAFFVKGVDFGGKNEQGLDEVILFTRKNGEYLPTSIFLDEKDWKAIVEKFVARYNHDYNTSSVLLGRIAAANEAQALVNQTFRNVCQIKNFIKSIRKLNEINFQPKIKLDEYKLLSLFLKDGEIYYSPKAKEIWTSNKKHPNYVVKRAGHLHTIGDFWTETGKQFDEQFSELLADFIKDTNVGADLNYSNFLGNVYYGINFDDLENYCKMFSAKVELFNAESEV